MSTHDIHVCNYHMVPVQGHLPFPMILQDRILFLHLLAIARNQYGMHGKWVKKPLKIFVPQHCRRHNVTVGNGYIRTV